MQIPVRDLKPGDILPAQQPTLGVGPSPRVVVLFVAPAQPARNMFDVITVPIGSRLCDVTANLWNGEAKIEVERPQLTNIEQAAGEMFKLLKRVQSIHFTPALDGEIRDLVTRLEPPVPPTLDEAIDVLRAVAACTPVNPPAVGSVFDQARKLLARVPANNG